MKKTFLAAAAGALLVVPLAFSADSHGVHWGYEGHAAPKHWGDLDESYQTCAIGKNQSPIDIDTRRVEQAGLQPIGFAYGLAAAEVVNNGHTVQANVPAAGTATIGGVAYQLVQFHFHTPSEERFDGKAYPLGAHLVHKNADGKLAVVTVLFRQGRENAALKPVFADLPKEGETKNLSLNLSELLPAGSGYYAFTGSLTTPPCSEDVRWTVLKTPVEISSAQLSAFRKLYKMNARPVQPLNGRVVQASE